MSARYFKIVTAHGTVVRAQRRDGLLCHCPFDSSSEEMVSVTAVSFPELPEWLFLLADPSLEIPIGMRHFWARGKCVPLRRVMGSVPETVGLGDPMRSGCYVIAPSLESGKEAHYLVGDCPHVMAWESFTLIECDASPAFVQIAGDVLACWRSFFTESDIATAIETCEGKGLEYALDALLPFLSMAQIELFACRLSLDHDYREKLKGLLPRNIWLTRVLPLFLEWKARGGLKNTSEHPVSVEEDSFLSYGDPSILSGFFHAVMHEIRKKEIAKASTCIVATLRNEGIYILEWLAYHKALGIEHFFLYSNQNNDSSEVLLKALHQEGVITYIENCVPEGVSPQSKAYGHAFNILPDILGFEWCFVLDGDEFLTLDSAKFSDINDYFAKFARFEADAVCMNWRFVGSSLNINGLSDIVTPLTLRNDKYVGAGAIGAGQRLVKSACRPSRTIQSRPHYPVTSCRASFTYRLTNGNLHEFRQPPPGIWRDPAFADQTPCNDLFVSHFYFKSMTEWVWKYARNTGLEAAQEFGVERYAQYWADAFVGQLSDSKDGFTRGISARKNEMLDALEKLRHVPAIRKAENIVRKSFESGLKQLHINVLEQNVSARIDENKRFIFDDFNLEIRGNIPLLPELEA